MALVRGGTTLLDKLRQEVELAGVEVVPFSVEQAELAIEAYHRYGRGVGKPGSLNLGDCFAYALAKPTKEPLLYKRDDFAKTDIRSAL